MKKHLFICLNFIVSVLLLAACHSEDMDFTKTESTTGKVQLSSLNVSVDVSDVTLEPRSRVTAPTSCNDFIITFYDSDSTKVQSYTYKDIPDAIELPVGKYTVEATSSEKAESGFDKPFFKGQASFEVVKDAMTTVSSIVCKLANIQVSATYSDEMKPYMGEDITIEMWIDENDKISFTPSDTRECFLAAPATSGNALKVRFSGTLDDEKVSKQLVFDEVDAGTWQQINFNMKIIMEGTLSGIDVTADKTTIVNSKVITTLPTEEEIDDFGKGEDPEPQPQPSGEITITGTSYNGSAFNIDEAQTMAFGSANFPLEVSIAATAGIQNLWVEITSDNTDFSEIGKGLGKFDLADPSTIDADLKELLVNYGLLDESIQIKGATEVPFKVTNFISLLAGFEGKHSFNLTVVDANSNTLSKSLVINVVK